jgi:hypothetical protein
MESQKLIEIANDVQNKSNKDLTIVANELSEEFQKTKELIIDLIEEAREKASRSVDFHRVQLNWTQYPLL